LFGFFVDPHVTPQAKGNKNIRYGRVVKIIYFICIDYDY